MMVTVTIDQSEGISGADIPEQAVKTMRTGSAALSLPSPRAFFAFLITERLSTTISEPGTGYDKMDSLVNDKQTYEVLKRDPTPALQRKLNNKLLTLKKTDKIYFRQYNRLRCSIPQPPKLYGLPKLHKPNIPMQPTVSFCGSQTYQLSKYLTNVLKPLTDESRHKLQSTETL